MGALRHGVRRRKGCRHDWWLVLFVLLVFADQKCGRGDQFGFLWCARRRIWVKCGRGRRRGREKKAIFSLFFLRGETNMHLAKNQVVVLDVLLKICIFDQYLFLLLLLWLLLSLFVCCVFLKKGKKKCFHFLETKNTLFKHTKWWVVV